MAAQAFDEMSGLKDSRELDGPAIVSGAVLAQGGGSPSTGTRVTVFAHPRAEDRLAVLDGKSDQMLEVTPLATTVTDTDGGFVLRLGHDHGISRLAADDAIIDVSLIKRRDG